MFLNCFLGAVISLLCLLQVLQLLLVFALDLLLQRLLGFFLTQNLADELHQCLCGLLFALGVQLLVEGWDNLFKPIPPFLVRLELLFGFFDFVSLLNVVVVERPNLCAKGLCSGQNSIFADLSGLFHVCDLKFPLQLCLLSLDGRDCGLQLLYLIVQDNFSVGILEYG